MNAFNWMIRIMEWVRDYFGGPAPPPEPEPRPAPRPAPSPEPEPGAPENETVNQKLLRLHNLYRKRRDSPPLALNPLLTAAAQKHAVWMAQKGKLSHKGKSRSTHHQRIKWEGYKPAASGENIAMGHRDPDDVMEGWMNSRGHRKNLLSDVYREVGFGLAQSRDGSLYWVAVFSRRLTGGIMVGTPPLPAHRIPDPLVAPDVEGGQPLEE